MQLIGRRRTMFILFYVLSLMPFLYVVESIDPTEGFR